jgi:hypothetical protein
VAEHGPGDEPTIEGSPSSLTLEQDDFSADFFAFTQQVRSDWTVSLPAGPAVSVGMTLNAASGTVDLGAGPVADVGGTFNASDITLDVGSAETPVPASLGLTFNASSGRLVLPAGSLTGGMTLNASSLSICLPADAEARIELEATLSSDDIASGGLNEVEGAWQTDGFATATNRIDLSVTSTVSSITLERPEVCQ